MVVAFVGAQKLPSSRVTKNIEQEQAKVSARYQLMREPPADGTLGFFSMGHTLAAFDTAYLLYAVHRLKKKNS